MAPAPPRSEIEGAIEAFVRGYTYTRSFTHPYLGERFGPLWVTRDAPRKRGDLRSEEWVAYRVSPEETDRVARENARGRYAVCAILDAGEPDSALREGYQALGYRLGHTEPLMVHSLQAIPEFTAAAEIQRVRSAEVAARLAAAARARQVLPKHLVDDSELRQYVAMVDDELVGWVRSIVCGKSTWCSNMFVKPEFRRRGIARAMLCRMLQEDREHGAETAVLLASHAGAKLYPVVGYRQIGMLYLFTPTGARDSDGSTSWSTPGCCSRSATS